MTQQILNQLFSIDRSLPEEITNELEMKFKLVQPGSFAMEDEEMVSNLRFITQPYYMCIYTVTQEQYAAIMNENPSEFTGDNQPVENVTWYEAKAFCEQLNQLYPRKDGYEYTLPTETQWEFAARGGNESKGYKFAGSDNIDEVACYGRSFDEGPQPVGLKSPNELGLYDMSGNVLEWCEDPYKDYQGRVVRGGSWYDDAQGCLVATPGYDHPDDPNPYLGFRVVAVLKFLTV